MLIYDKVLAEIKNKKNGKDDSAEQLARDALDKFEKKAIEGLMNKKKENKNL